MQFKRKQGWRKSSMKSYRGKHSFWQRRGRGGEEDKSRKKAKCMIWFIHLSNHHGQPLLPGVRRQINHKVATPQEPRNGVETHKEKVKYRLFIWDSHTQPCQPVSTRTVPHSHKAALQSSKPIFKGALRTGLSPWAIKTVIEINIGNFE